MYDNTPFVIIGNSIMPVSSLIALEEQKAAAKPEDDAGAASALASKLNPFNLLS